MMSYEDANDASRNFDIPHAGRSLLVRLLQRELPLLWGPGEYCFQPSVGLGRSRRRFVPGAPL